MNVNYDTTFNKAAGTYTNTGQLNVPSGKTLTISNGGTLNQNTGGTFTLSGELENSGSTFNMNGGTMNFGASALVDNGNFNYLGGNIVGDVKLRNTIVHDRRRHRSRDVPARLQQYAGQQRRRGSHD